MTPNDISRDALRAVFSLTGTQPGAVSARQAIMGGHGTITLVGASEQLLTRAWELASQCEKLWTRFSPDSDISRLNLAEGKPVVVDPLTFRLISAMRVGHEISLGAFDPTLLVDELTAGYGASVLDPTRITRLPASAVSPGNIAGIRLSDTSVTLPLGTVLDAGGIGKGLAADIVCEFALAEGAWGAMAEFGGDIVVAGNAPDGVAWRLGIENPFDTQTHAAIIRLSQGAIVTSSQRKRRFGQEGDETHHLIDPATHLSAQTTVQTVTVIAATGARAEALTKPGFLQDTTHYLKWLPSVGAAGMVIDDTGAERVSENWMRYQ
ncbi:FAD:protein FMN transferase [Alpinimonas psychrophila]|uniref:FAD:protein FMN transferase n=1 Tax=Alpinimonas psychrophila TaxID=748908 RepID=A0A7W3JU89_9MICO|nr:thiamine biosynthesis lipoprotein [Alpinimonas psychrophila]